MKSESLSPEILALENGKEDVCVSIIVPTNRSNPIKKEDFIRLKNAVKKATDQLNSNYPKETAKELNDSINDLYGRINIHDTKDGYGLFASRKIKLLKNFEFQVKEKIVIANSFEIRDILLEQQYSKPYVLLLITRKSIRLFNGKMNSLQEITDQNFPREFIDDYEYMHPNPASSFSGRALEKAFEKDKSIMDEIRGQRFMHEADGVIDDYLNNDFPLVVCAEVKDLAYFEQITKHKKNISIELKEGLSSLTVTEIAGWTWPAVMNYFIKTEDRLIDEFRELGPARSATKVDNVWKSVVEGRGFKLLVEKDYSCTAYLDQYGYILYLQLPETPHTVLIDAVDDLIEKAIQMNTQVILVQNDKLKDYDRVALMLRY